MILTPTIDGSLLDDEGLTIFYSIQRFVDEISHGRNCFLCGRSPDNCEFNDEHVIPDWLLSFLDLHNSSVNLPNGAYFKYGQYKVACCESCNSKLGVRLEAPVSKLFKTDTQITSSNSRSLFLWMCLLFFKTHIKDKEFRFNLDRREADYSISEIHKWNGSLHHIHCLVRSLIYDTELDFTVFGSTLLLPVKTFSDQPAFDYADNSECLSVMIRVNNKALICFLDDGGAVSQRMQDDIQKIEGPLSPVQLRELFAHANYCRFQLKETPRYFSTFENNKHQIVGKIPRFLENKPHNLSKLGSLIHWYCRDWLGFVEDKKLRERIEFEMLQARWTFLKNPDGSFAHDSIEPYDDNLLKERISRK